MPDEEVLEEGVLNPVKPEIQDPLLQAILEENGTPATAPTGEEQPNPLPNPTDIVDCVVIGTGAGGAPLLARLAMARRANFAR